MIGLRLAARTDGTDIYTGTQRFTFGSAEPYDGF